MSDCIEKEDDRVDFLTVTAQALASKAKIKLNTKRLYAADGRAVKELLKVATMLYNASKANEEAAKEDPLREVQPLNSRIKDIKLARTLATEITDKGARLYDLLGKEKDVKQEASAVSSVIAKSPSSSPKSTGRGGVRSWRPTTVPSPPIFSTIAPPVGISKRVMTSSLSRQSAWSRQRIVLLWALTRPWRPAATRGSTCADTYATHRFSQSSRDSPVGRTTPSSTSS